MTINFISLIYNFDGKLSFNDPDKGNVSYSPINNTADQIDKNNLFNVKKLASIMKMLGHNYVDILKLDIEGAEYCVIKDIMESKIFPSQILIEFHHRFRGYSIYNTKNTINLLKQNGYQIFNISDSLEEYSFIRT